MRHESSNIRGSDLIAQWVSSSAFRQDEDDHIPPRGDSIRRPHRIDIIVAMGQRATTSIPSSLPTHSCTPAIDRLCAVCPSSGSKHLDAGSATGLSRVQGLQHAKHVDWIHG